MRIYYVRDLIKELEKLNPDRRIKVYVDDTDETYQIRRINKARNPYQIQV